MVIYYIIIIMIKTVAMTEIPLRFLSISISVLITMYMMHVATGEVG
jgi:hypothetical protein